MWIFICIFARKIFNYMPMDNRNTVQLNSLVGFAFLLRDSAIQASLMALAAQSVASVTLQQQISKTK